MTYPHNELTDEGLRPAHGARIREATFADYSQIAALQSRHGLRTRSYDSWRALWSGNPAFVRASRQLPVGWVLESADGEVAGFVGSLPLSYELNGQEVRAATAYSWVVDHRYRGYSLMLLNEFLRQEYVDLFVCTTANAATEKALRGLRFSRVPAGNWDTSGFWITHYTGFARSALRASSLPLPGALARPLSAMLWLRDKLATLTHGRVPDGGFETCGTFDDGFDQFWNELKRENGRRLLAVRNREALEWHFGAALRGKTAWIITARKHGRIVAYAAFDRMDHPSLGLKRVRLADFQALEGCESLILPALEWMLNRCRREKIHVVENAGCWVDCLRGVRAAAPYRRRMKSWLFYYRARRQELSDQLRDPAVWNPSSYDGDASI